MIYKVRDKQGRLRMSTCDFEEAASKYQKLRLLRGYAVLEICWRSWDIPLLVYGD